MLAASCTEKPPLADYLRVISLCFFTKILESAYDVIKIVFGKNFKKQDGRLSYGYRNPVTTMNSDYNNKSTDRRFLWQHLPLTAKAPWTAT
jgi:hypothetical protein